MVAASPGASRGRAARAREVGTTATRCATDRDTARKRLVCAASLGTDWVITAVRGNLLAIDWAPAHVMHRMPRPETHSAPSRISVFFGHLRPWSCRVTTN